MLLNINLAIINMLPIPVLDGGHIMMSIVEKIRRRPLSQKFVEYVTTGFAGVTDLVYALRHLLRTSNGSRFSAQCSKIKVRFEEPQNVPAEPAPAAPQ